MNDSEFNAKSEIAEENLRERLIDSPLETFPVKSQKRTIRLRRSGFAYCPVCEKPVELMSFMESAELFKTDTQDIEFLAKHGDLHRIHNRKGEVLICSDSLFQCFDSRETRLLDSHFEIEIHKTWESK